MDDPTPEGGALYEHLLKVPRLRRLLQSLSVGDETRWTMGLLGILRSIKIDGQRTPAQIARERGLTHQKTEKLMNGVKDWFASNRTRTTKNPA